MHYCPSKALISVLLLQKMCVPPAARLKVQFRFCGRSALVSVLLARGALKTYQIREAHLLSVLSGPRHTYQWDASSKIWR